LPLALAGEALQDRETHPGFMRSNDDSGSFESLALRFATKISRLESELRNCCAVAGDVMSVPDGVLSGLSMPGRLLRSGALGARRHAIERHCLVA